MSFTRRLCPNPSIERDGIRKGIPEHSAMNTALTDRTRTQTEHQRRRFYDCPPPRTQAAVA
jgi:hypothetical protein